MRENSSKREAYYIIDAPTVFSNSPSAAYEAVPNGWNADNRFMTTGRMSDPERYIHIKGDGKEYASINRKFRTEEDGILTLEILITAKGKDESVFLSFEDEKGKRVLSVCVKNGCFALCGRSFSESTIRVSDKEPALYSIILTLDLDNKRAAAVINNQKLSEVTTENCEVCCLELGVEKGGVGSVKLEYVRMWKNFALNEHFLIPAYCEGQKPCLWEVSGGFHIEGTPSCKGLEIYSMRTENKSGEYSSARKSFAALSGKFSLEAYILLPKKANGAVVSFTSAGRNVFTFETKDEKIYFGESMVNDYIENIWQGLCIDADTESKTAVIKVNGKKKLEAAFCADMIDGVSISFSPDRDGVLWFDDVKAYTLDDPDDYPEKPVVADVSPYRIGTNVCWLWRDFNCGEGWDSVSSFPEFEPLLGYYDEGSREYADWEIKYLAEHGINFIHACWYSPNTFDDVPIKNEDYSFAAMHDGYMNARYSELVQFCIMWENSGNKDCSGFEKFRDRLWNYWVEYYFKDPRYLRLDNKAVLTVFMPQNMEKTFGGAENVRKAVEFMNEDIKKYGYDGIILLSDNEFYGSYDYLNSLGFDGSYAYQWGKRGSSGAYQIEQNHKFEELSEKGKSHHIPTVSVGFNLVGRGFVRSGFINQSEHLEVCREIKKILDKNHTGTWKDNTLVVSTWNEYSEGHYVAPTKSINFDLLENVRKTFSNSPSDSKGICLYPTEAQKERVTHLYPPKHSPLRRLLLEKSEFEALDAQSDFTVVSGFDMSLEENAKAWVSFNAVSNLEQKGGVLCGSSELTDPGIINSASLDMDAKDISALRIRMKTNASPDDEIDLFYATKEDPSFSTDKWIGCKLEQNEGFNDYYFCTEKSALWQGTITHLRIDPIPGKGSFEIASIDFLKLSGLTHVYVGENRIAFPNAVKKTADGDFEAVLDKQFLTLLGLYFEWDRFTRDGVLTLKDRSENTYIIEIGSDTAFVNDTGRKTGFTPRLWDGLPVINICAFLKLLGRDYRMDNSDIFIDE